jgi:hypothetical protein
LFPVEVRIENLHTQIGNRVPAEAFFSRSVPVAVGDAAIFYNAEIAVDPTGPGRKVVLGRVNAEISYGRPGALKYRANAQYYLALVFVDGAFTGLEHSTTELEVAA